MEEKQQLQVLPSISFHYNTQQAFCLNLSKYFSVSYYFTSVDTSKLYYVYHLICS